MIALIVGNGDVSREIADKLPKGAYVICADGGYRHMKTLGLRADILIGDMDSVGEETEPDTVLRYPVRKDFTDGEIAVNYALEKGFSEIVMVGFVGTRMDHTLTNIFLLKKIKEQGKNGCVIDAHNEIYCSADITLGGKKGDIVSIIPVGGDVDGVTTEGLEYPLCGETLEFGKGRGVSNVMTGERCRITVENGTALIIKSRD